MVKPLYRYRRVLELDRVGVLFEASTLDYYRYAQVLFHSAGAERSLQGILPEYLISIFQLLSHLLLFSD